MKPRPAHKLSRRKQRGNKQLRTYETFDANERDVIRQRRRGWEKADTATLAAVFDTTREVINRIVRDEEKRIVDAIVDNSLRACGLDPREAREIERHQREDEQ